MKTKYALLVGIAMLGGCSSQVQMQHYVPADCHGASVPFSTFTIEQVNMPGFIQSVMDESVAGALARIGLVRSAGDIAADLNVIAKFELIDRNPPPREKDPFAEPVATSDLNRFVIHVDIDVFDNRGGKLIWTGALNRSHAIEGGETFHDDRAILTISTTLDSMFEGLTTPCD